MGLFGDLDQNYFILLSFCRYESLSASHLEQIFSFLRWRDAQSFPNNKLAVVNNFPGHSLNSLIQDVALHSYIVEFDRNAENIYVYSIYACCVYVYVYLCVHARKHVYIYMYYLCLKI